MTGGNGIGDSHLIMIGVIRSSGKGSIGSITCFESSIPDFESHIVTFDEYLYVGLVIHIDNIHCSNRIVFIDVYDRVVKSRELTLKIVNSAQVQVHS